MPELTRLPSDCTADDIVEVNERDGGVIVEGWLSTAVLERFNAEIEPWLTAHAGTNSGSAQSDEFLGYRTRRLQGLSVKAPTFVEIMTDDRIVGFARSVMALISPTVILNNGEVIDIGPGETSQPWHRDNDAWIHASAPAPLMICSSAATRSTPVERIPPRIGVAAPCRRGSAPVGSARLRTATPMCRSPQPRSCPAEPKSCSAMPSMTHPRSVAATSATTTWVTRWSCSAREPRVAT